MTELAFHPLPLSSNQADQEGLYLPAHTPWNDAGEAGCIRQAGSQATPGKARPYQARQGHARQGKAMPGKARPGQARPGQAVHDSAWQGKA